MKKLLLICIILNLGMFSFPSSTQAESTIDLEIVGDIIVTPQEVHYDDDIILEAYVKNNSEQNISTSLDWRFDGLGYGSCLITINLEPNELKKIKCILPQNQDKNNILISLEIDPSNKIDELDESNNKVGYNLNINPTSRAIPYRRFVRGNLKSNIVMRYFTDFSNENWIQYTSKVNEIYKSFENDIRFEFYYIPFIWQNPEGNITIESLYNKGYRQNSEIIECAIYNDDNNIWDIIDSIYSEEGFNIVNFDELRDHMADKLSDKEWFNRNHFYNCLNNQDLLRQVNMYRRIINDDNIIKVDDKYILYFVRIINKDNNSEYIIKTKKELEKLPNYLTDLLRESGLNEDFIKNEKQLIKNIDKQLSNRMKGKILLQVENNGEGWYVNPLDTKRHYLGRPADAFNIMRELGLGISEENFSNLNGYAPQSLSGRILLRVEANGEAYYVNPDDQKLHYLGRPADAFKLMRELGLGIANQDIQKISIY